MSGSFHPAFAPLHARLSGIPAEMAQVGGRRLSALYPVEMASYATFLIDFYTVNSHLHVSEIRESGSGIPLMRVATAMLPGYTSLGFFKNHPLYTDANVSKEIRPLLPHLNVLLAPQKANIALRRQLATVMKVQYLLSHWNDAAFATLPRSERVRFLAKVQELGDFFGVPTATTTAQSQAATCAREAQLVS